MYAYYSMTLNAGEAKTVYAYGRYFRVFDNTIASTASPLVRLGSNAPQTVPAGVGIDLFDGVDPDKNTFAEIVISNPASVAMTINFGISSSKVDDNRFSASGIVNTSDANVLAELQGITTAGTFAADATVGLAAVSALASNANRKACLIQADATNTGVIYLGFDNSVTSAKKIISLTAGQSFAVDDYRGDIYAIASIAGQKISASWW